MNASPQSETARRCPNTDATTSDSTGMTRDGVVTDVRPGRLHLRGLAGEVATSFYGSQHWPRSRRGVARPRLRISGRESARFSALQRVSICGPPPDLADNPGGVDIGT
jgi:hypothetical protein